MKRSLTIGAVGALIMGVSVPAAALPTVQQPASTTAATVAAPTTSAAPQMFAASADVAATTVTRDTYTVEEIKPEPVYAPAYGGSYGGTYSGAFAGFTVWPANGPVNDGFGYRDGGEMHNGIDIMAPAGSAVVAAAPGVVIEAGYSGGWGNYVKVDHGDGIASLYSHLSSIAVSPGQVVGAGEYLGAVGNTGYATAYHLHFEVWVYGSRVDPMPWMP